MLDNSCASGYPFNWTTCLESFPEFYRPPPSNAFLDEYGVINSGSTSAGSLRHYLSQPLQLGSLSTTIPETTNQLLIGDVQQDETMTRRQMLQTQQATIRGGHGSNRELQDCCSGLASAFHQSLATSGSELVTSAAGEHVWKCVTSISTPLSADFQTSLASDTAYGRYGGHSTLKSDHQRHRSKMRLIDEPLHHHLGTSSALSRPLIVDPFFDVTGLLVDDLLVQSSTLPAAFYSSPLDHPTMLTDNGSPHQHRHSHDDGNKLHQHRQSASAQHQQQTSPAMASSSWSESCRSSVLQHQRRRRSVNERNDESSIMSNGSKTTANEGRVTLSTSGTSMSGSSLKTNADVMTTSSHRFQSNETTADTGDGVGNVEPHLISPEWTNIVTSINLHHPLAVHKETSSATRFQYVMCAATSPAVKQGDEQLTYLNQGQSYEIKLKRLSELQNEQLVTSIIRVIFHERRLQYVEREQLEHWRMLRPSERFLDIDVPISYGLLNVKTDPSALNSVEVTWNAESEAGVFVKVNCISTEFTARKHGGEKGVPFRVQIETYRPASEGGEGGGAVADDVIEKRLLHCASCQIKVFKPKGADRKQKTDTEKVEKQSDFDRDKYLPSFDYTVLNEIPSEHVTQYLDQLRRQSLQHDHGQGDVDSSTYSSVGCCTASAAGAVVKEESLTSVDCCDVSLSSVIGGALSGRCNSAKSLSSLQPCFEFSEDNSYLGTPDGHSKFDYDVRCPPWSTITTPTPSRIDATMAVIPVATVLSPSWSSCQVVQWLSTHRFHNFIQVFQNFSDLRYFIPGAFRKSADLLKLTRQDIIQLCGLPDGIRLNNILHSRSLRPRLTIYVYQKQTISLSARIECSEQSVAMPTVSTAISTSSSSSPSAGYWSPMSDVSAGGRPRLHSQTIPVSSPSAFFPASPCSQSSVPEAMMSSLSGSSSLSSSCSSSVLLLSSSRRRRSSVHRVNRCRSAIELSTTTNSQLVDSDCRSTIGDLLDEVDNDCSSLMAVTKRRRHDDDDDEENVLGASDDATIEINANNRIYHAVYLDYPTRCHLAEKLAALYGFDFRQVAEMVIMEAVTGVRVYVTDSVVQNIEDQSTYAVQLRQDNDEPAKFHIMLQSERS